MPFSSDPVATAWRDGFRRVMRAPTVLTSVFLITLLATLPLAITLRGMIETHLGRSLRSEQVADGADLDWWQEFAFQTTGIGSTFTPSVIGFAATLDSISSVADGRRPQVEVAGALAVYLLAWIFLSGGIIDRYARQRPTHAHGFFAAAGVFFWRFLRLGLIAGVVYGWLFVWVHQWLFGTLYARLTRDVAVERSAFFWRLALYVLFGALVVVTNLVVDYAKIRLVVEDRRSVMGALAASTGFVVRRGGRVWALYAINTATFLVLIGIWAIVAPGAGSAGLLMWLAFILTQSYVLARLVLKLQFMASQIALFQASLAHAEYTATPELVWPESPAAESIRS
jgi:hypothetical protein